MTRRQIKSIALRAQALREELASATTEAQRKCIREAQEDLERQATEARK